MACRSRVSAVRFPLGFHASVQGERVKQTMSSRRRRQPGTNSRECPPVQQGHCRRCGRKVPKGRFTFCGEDCVHEWRLRTTPAYVRLKLFERDRAICAICKRNSIEGLTGGKAWPVHRIVKRSGHLWQADHIVPVVEGGGECGLDNYRTLCTECHKQVTRELAARRAAERRKAKQ